MPRLASALASTLAVSRSGPIGQDAVRKRLQQRVVRTPKSVYTEANSEPMTPPPMTATRSGRPRRRCWCAWSEVTMRSPSISRPGSERGSEPEQMITPLPVRV